MWMEWFDLLLCMSLFIWKIKVSVERLWRLGPLSRATTVVILSKGQRHILQLNSVQFLLNIH